MMALAKTIMGTERFIIEYLLIIQILTVDLHIRQKTRKICSVTLIFHGDVLICVDGIQVAVFSILEKYRVLMVKGAGFILRTRKAWEYSVQEDMKMPDYNKDNDDGVQ